MTSVFELSPLEAFELAAWAEQRKEKLAGPDGSASRPHLSTGSDRRRLVYVAVRRRRCTKVLLNAFAKEQGHV